MNLRPLGYEENDWRLAWRTASCPCSSAASGLSPPSQAEASVGVVPEGLVSNSVSKTGPRGRSSASLEAAAAAARSPAVRVRLDVACAPHEGLATSVGVWCPAWCRPTLTNKLREGARRFLCLDAEAEVAVRSDPCGA